MWTNANNWSPAPGEPLAGDFVAVNIIAGSQTVSYNTNNNFLFGSLLVNATGGGTVTLTQSSKNLSTGDETVGSDGKGIHTQNSGSTTIDDLLLLGQACHRRRHLQ